MSKELILSRLQGACVAREYCCEQIRKKLKKQIEQQKLTEQEADEILQELINDKFIDDSRYANAFCRDKYRLAGWGRRKIEFYLKRERISPSIITLAIDDNYPNSNTQNNEILLKLLERKWLSLFREENIQKRREKLIRFALSRGFDYSEIKALLVNLYQDSL